MSQRSIGIVLLIGGVLAFLWAGSQISNLPPDILMPLEIVRRNHALIDRYHFIQVISGLAAIGGGFFVFRKWSVVLLIGGVLVFLWAGSAISNLPPDYLMPFEIVRKNHALANTYRMFQGISAVAAVGGGVLMFRKGETS